MLSADAEPLSIVTSPLRATTSPKIKLATLSDLQTDAKRLLTGRLDADLLSKLIQPKVITVIVLCNHCGKRQYQRNMFINVAVHEHSPDARAAVFCPCLSSLTVHVCVVDSTLERDAFHSVVLPAVRRHCLERGFQLECIDLSWNVKEISAYGHACRKLSPDIVTRSLTERAALTISTVGCKWRNAALHVTRHM